MLLSASLCCARYDLYGGRYITKNDINYVRCGYDPDSRPVKMNINGLPHIFPGEYCFNLNLPHATLDYMIINSDKLYFGENEKLARKPPLNVTQSRSSLVYYECRDSCLDTPRRQGCQMLVFLSCLPICSP
jgi:hypothetical protein